MGLGCCKIESLPKSKVSISHAQVAGAFPGVQDWVAYGTRYEELQLVSTTSASSRSRVTEIRSVSSGLRYVCRRCPYEEAPLHDEPEVLAAHLEAVCDLDHPHLCKLVECFQDHDSGDYLLVSEHAHQPTLLDYVDEHGLPNGDIDAADCIRQILSALALGHQRGIAHGRLRHDCFLIANPPGAKVSPGGKENKHHKDRSSGKDQQQESMPPQIKICDMGLGYALRDPIGLGTANYEGILYMAPEHAWAEHDAHVAENPDHPEHDNSGASQEPLLGAITDGSGSEAEPVPEAAPPGTLQLENGMPKNDIIPHWSSTKGGVAPPGADKVDVWAVGVIAFNLLSGCLPFEADDEEKLAMHLRCHRPKFTKETWGDIPAKAYNAVDMMLKLTPNMRPSAADMLRHPWLRLTRKKTSKQRKFSLYRNAIVNLQEGQFKKLVMRIIAEQLSSSHSHRQEAMEVFRSLDKDRDGLLSFDEFNDVLQKLPNLEKYTDPVMLFEAADRNRSGTLDASEFLAATLPPQEAREDKNLWYAFRAFDTNESGTITLDEVTTTLQLLEGALMSAEQLEEVASSIKDELATLGFGSNLLVNLGLHDHDDDSMYGRAMERASALMPCGGRSLDFGEFVYLCSTKQNDFKTPGWAKKEGYRIVSICCDVDMYHQAHRTGNSKWPPMEGASAASAVSVYEKKGLFADTKRRQDSRQKSAHRYSQKGDGSARGSARHSARNSQAHHHGHKTTPGQPHFMPTHHGHHFHHDEHHHHHHHHQGEHHHHHHHHHHSQHHGEEHEHWSPGNSARNSGRHASGRKPSSREASARVSGRDNSARTTSTNPTPPKPPPKKKPRKPSDYDSDVETDDEHEEEA